MKKIFMIILPAVFLFTAAFIPGNNVMEEIETIAIHNENNPLISIRVWFKSGAQDDPTGKEGLAYITGQMLTESGTFNNSYENILEKLFPMAASFSADVSTEMTIFSGAVHQDKFDEFKVLFADQLLNPVFDETVFKRIKQNTLNYLKTTLKYSSDEELGKAVLYNNIFAGTGYGHILQGTVSGVESITIEDVKNFYRKYYNSDNCLLGITGNLSEKSKVEYLKTQLMKLPEGDENITDKPEPADINGINVTIVKKKANASAISMGYPIDILRGSKDWYALAIANSWLGEHRNSSSHLYQVIREARGLNYGDYSYIENFPNGGWYQMPPVNVSRKQQIFEIWIRPVPLTAAHFSIRAALYEYQKLIDNGMTQGQFELTKKFLKNYVLHYAPTADKRLGYAIDDKFYGLEFSHLEKFREMMDVITLEDVNNALKKHLQYDNMEIAVIYDDAEQLKEDLVNNTPSPLEYGSPKPEIVYHEDEIISNFKLDIKPENVTIIEVEELFK